MGKYSFMLQSANKFLGRTHVFQSLDERQITHLICARLKYDLYEFFRGVLGLLPVLFLV